LEKNEVPEEAKAQCETTINIFKFTAAKPFLCSAVANLTLLPGSFQTCHTHKHSRAYLSCSTHAASDNSDQLKAGDTYSAKRCLLPDNEMTNEYTSEAD